MSLVQDEDMIQALSADGTDHPLDKRILPGRARGDADLANPHLLDSPRKLLAVDAVSVTEQILRSRTVRGRFDELPSGPDCRGMFRDVQVEEFAAVMPEDDEDEEQAEGEG